MRNYFFLLLVISNLSSHAKEWRSFRIYQKETHQEKLSKSDWLKSDRTHNTMVWQLANAFNLENNFPQEYKNIVERRDFYKWLYKEVENRGHDVVWFKMVHFISKKLHVIETVPFTIFANNKIMQYANDCSKTIFNNAFNEVNNLFKLEFPLLGDNALLWDKAILYNEQYVWVDLVINNIDAKTEQKIEYILQGKFLYGLLVNKIIRFDGDLSNKEDRYNFALNKLRLYCEKKYK